LTEKLVRKIQIEKNHKYFYKENKLVIGHLEKVSRRSSGFVATACRFSMVEKSVKIFV